MYACIHSVKTPEKLPDLAGIFSPAVETAGPDTVVFSLRGLGRLFGDERHIARELTQRASALGLDANIAIAATPGTAMLAARHLSGVTLIPPGEESRHLGSLTIESLPIAPELYEILDRWGIHTLSQFARLPEAGLAERLGLEGLALHALTRGLLDRPLQINRPPSCYEDGTDLDFPLALLEPLLFLLSRQLRDLCGRLRSQSLAAAEIHLFLALENKTEHVRSIRLPVPSLDTKAMLKLLQLDLEAHPPAAAILKVVLRIDPASPRYIQNDLFLPAAPEPEKLEVTLAKIRAMVGEDRVGVPELVDTHRPGAFRLGGGAKSTVTFLSTSERVPRCALSIRLFRPPRPAQVELAGGTPHRIAARGVRGKVIQIAGPWRTSGDWWTSDPWNRDEWDLALSDGALYRLYWDRALAQWFLEGSYD